MHCELFLPDKDRAIEGLVVYNSWDLELDGFVLAIVNNRPLRYETYKYIELQWYLEYVRYMKIQFTTQFFYIVLFFIVKVTISEK